MLEILERLWTIGIATPEPAPEAWNWSLTVDLITGLVAVGNLILIIVIWRSNKRQVERQIHGGEPILHWSWDEWDAQATATFINPRKYPIVFERLVVTPKPFEAEVKKCTSVGPRGTVILEVNTVIDANQAHSLVIDFEIETKRETHAIPVEAFYLDTAQNTQKTIRRNGWVYQEDLLALLDDP